MKTSHPPGKHSFRNWASEIWKGGKSQGTLDASVRHLDSTIWGGGNSGISENSETSQPSLYLRTM